MNTPKWSRWYGRNSGGIGASIWRLFGCYWLSFVNFVLYLIKTTQKQPHGYGRTSGGIGASIGAFFRWIWFSFGNLVLFLIKTTPIRPHWYSSTSGIIIASIWGFFWCSWLFFVNFDFFLSKWLDWYSGNSASYYHTLMLLSLCSKWYDEYIVCYFCQFSTNIC